MTILADHEIEALCADPETAMIAPFDNHLTRSDGQTPRISHGLSSYGYDVRLGTGFKRFRELPSAFATNWSSAVIDPLHVNEEELHTFTMEEPFDIMPGRFLLAHTMEYLRIPPDVTGRVCDKSTYARCGLALQNTVLEAGWHGQVTLELSNHSNRPIRIYPGQGIAQILFERGTPCRVSYADRSGKYQGQTGVTLPRG